MWPWQRRRFLYFKGVRRCTAATTSDLIEKTKDSNSIASTHLCFPRWSSTVRVFVWRRGIFYLGISSHVEKRRGRGTRRSWMASLPQPREKSWFIAEKKEGEGGERVKEEEDSFLLTYLAKSVSLYKRRRKNCLLVRDASQGDDWHEDEPGRKFCSVFRRTILDFFWHKLENKIHVVEAQDLPGTFSVGHFPLSFLARDFEEVKVYKLP